MQKIRAGDAIHNVPPPPRAIRRKTWGSGCWLAFLRLFILPHTLVALFLLWQIPQDLYVTWFGTPVTAVVDGRDMQRSKKSRFVYRVKFHYELNNRVFHDSASVKEEEYNRIQIGDRVDGRASSILGHGTFVGPGWQRQSILVLCFIAVFWNGILSVFLYSAWVLPIQQRWVAKHGQAAAGTITKTYVSGGRQRRYVVEYNFNTAAGQEVKGKSYISMQAYKEASVGGTVTVLYTQRDPRWNLPYEFSDFVAKPAVDWR
jgi:hypothetical protein